MDHTKDRTLAGPVLPHVGRALQCGGRPLDLHGGACGIGRLLVRGALSDGAGLRCDPRHHARGYTSRGRAWLVPPATRCELLAKWARGSRSRPSGRYMSWASRRAGWRSSVDARHRLDPHPWTWPPAGLPYSGGTPNRCPNAPEIKAEACGSPQSCEVPGSHEYWTKGVPRATITSRWTGAPGDSEIICRAYQSSEA